MVDRTPVVDIEIDSEIKPGEKGFLQLVRFRYRNIYENGGKSRPYRYEYIHRKGYDSVAIALYHEKDGNPEMAYRSGIRVPVYFRKELKLSIPDSREYLFTPEAVAGSMEPEDIGIEGLRKRVVAEVLEEAGFVIGSDEVHGLGGGFFPSHGQSSEKIHLAAARVDPSTMKNAEGDGSVNERDAPPIHFEPIGEILNDCCRGKIEDPKIEILATRLCIYLGYHPFLKRYATDSERELLKDAEKALESGSWNSLSSD